jgi:hypothetical protein
MASVHFICMLRIRSSNSYRNKTFVLLNKKGFFTDIAQSDIVLYFCNVRAEDKK